jgi:GNAT superfamily N-acetyltransferase
MDRRDYLNPDKNPFFEHVDVALWIAVKDGRDVGRVAAVVDRDFIEFHGEQTGYFGMFECIDDREVAQALLDRASSWLEEREMERMIGPMELSTNYQCGVLIDGFDRDPCVNMPFNPPYYDALLASCGMTKEKDLFQWRIDTSKPLAPRIDRISKMIAKREGITVRNYDFDDWDAEVERTLEIYNSAWVKNWGFVPMSPKEFRHVAKDLKMVLNPKITFIAEVEGRPVAFALSIKNVNPTLKKLDGKLFPSGALRLVWDLMINDKVNGARLILLGVRKEYRKRGIDSILFAETFRECGKVGYHDSEIGWTLEDNELVNRAIVSMNGFHSSTYRIYQRGFGPEADGAGDATEGAVTNEG